MNEPKRSEDGSTIALRLTGDVALMDGQRTLDIACVMDSIEREGASWQRLGLASHVAKDERTIVLTLGPAINPEFFQFALASEPATEIRCRASDE